MKVVWCGKFWTCRPSINIKWTHPKTWLRQKTGPRSTRLAVTWIWSLTTNTVWSIWMPEPCPIPPLLYDLTISDRTWLVFPLQLTRQYFATALQLYWRQQSEKCGVVCWGKNRNRDIELLWLTTLLRGMGRGRSIHLGATLVAGTVYTQYQGTGSVFGCLNIQIHSALKAGSISKLNSGTSSFHPTGWWWYLFSLLVSQRSM